MFQSHKTDNSHQGSKNRGKYQCLEVREMKRNQKRDGKNKLTYSQLLSRGRSGELPHHSMLVQAKG
jgi:hypothetical protein